MLPSSRNARPPNIAFSVSRARRELLAHALGEVFVVGHAVSIRYRKRRLRKCILALCADVFQVLAEPRRREVLALLADEERTAGDIAARFDVTRQAISQHLRILLAAGLIAERRDGARRWYQARPEDSRRCAPTSRRCGRRALSRLKAAAEREHASGRRDAGRN